MCPLMQRNLCATTDASTSSPPAKFVITLLITVSLCRYHALVRGKWQQYYWALLASTFQLMGTIFYQGVEWSDGFVHIPDVVGGVLCVASSWTVSGKSSRVILGEKFNY